MKLPDLKSKTGIRDRSILEIFYSTGIRISELVNIKILDKIQKMLRMINKHYIKQEK